MVLICACMYACICVYGGLRWFLLFVSCFLLVFFSATSSFLLFVGCFPAASELVC